MSTCAKIQQDSVALAALRPDDEERQRAFAHARGCDTCAPALAEGARILTRLDAPIEGPSPTLRAHTIAAVFAEWPTPRTWPLLLALSGAVVVVWGLLLATSRTPASDPQTWVEAGVVAALAVAGVWLTRVRGASLGVALAASVGLALYAGRVPDLLPMLGLKCAAIELIGAAPAIGLALYFGRRRDTWGPPLAAVAALGALAAQGALHVGCHARDASLHLLVFHVGAVVVAALLGAVLARRWGPQAVARDTRS